MTAEKPVLLVVIGSTRPGRAGLPVARWFEQVARDHGGFTVEVADLAEIGLPLMDEPNHPRLGRYTQEHTRAWSAVVERADAVVFVTPEYNHSYSAVLKNAIDYLWREWVHKAVAVVSYGGVTGGVRAVQALKPVFLALAMVPIPDAVLIPFINQRLSGDGDERVFTADEDIEASAKALLEGLTAWMPASRTLRGA